jgi:hypothetical protein
MSAVTNSKANKTIPTISSLSNVAGKLPIKRDAMISGRMDDDDSDAADFGMASETDSICDPSYVPNDSDDLFDSSDSDSLDEVLDKLDARNKKSVEKPTTALSPAHTASPDENNFDSQAAADNEADKRSLPKIVVIATNNVGARKYDKVSYCYYCQKPQSKLPRHLVKVHATEAEVASYIAENNSEKKGVALLKLRNHGNHRHNADVIKKGEGQFYVMYRPRAEADYRDYRCCRYCFGCLAKNTLWKHACPLAPKEADGSSVCGLRKCGLNLTDGNDTTTSAVGWAGLVAGFRNDEISQIAQRDHLIMILGKALCNKFGKSLQQCSLKVSECKSSFTVVSLGLHAVV